MRRRHRTAHRRIWFVLAVVLPLLVLAGVALRPSGPDEARPVRLAPPAKTP